MKRLLFVAVLALALVLGTAGIAMANFAIHGGYLTDTDGCAGCHRAHTAFSSLTWNDSGGDPHSALLISNATTMRDFCYACHGNGTLNGAKTNVQGGVLDGAILSDTQAGLGEVGKPLNGGGFEVLGYGNAADATRTYGADAVNVGQRPATSQHDVDGTGNWYTTGSTIWGSWGPGAANGPGATVDLNCTNCHDPHGSSNYRLLNDTVQGRTVGGYLGDFKTAVDPDPDPWIISNEIGYPNGENGADLGFRLHKAYWHYTSLTPQDGDYMPDYTNAAYAAPPDNNMNGAYNNIGMSGWCTRACHDQYLVKTGSLNAPTSASYGTYNTASAYNAGDGVGSMVRHRHPVSVPVGVFDGDRALQLNPEAWTAWDPTIKWVDIPLLHLTKGGEKQGSQYNTSPNPGGTQTNSLDDGIDCLTCHRAHGTDARMSGYANTDSNDGNALPNSGIAGTVPTNDSALLRADNRGVCERCHNK